MFKPLFTASRLDAIWRCSGAATLPHIEEHERDSALALAGVKEHAALLGPNLPANLWQWLTASGGDPVFEQPHLFDFSGAQPLAEIAPPATSDRYVEVVSPTTGAGTPDAYTIAVTPTSILLRVGDLKSGVGQSSGTLPPPEKSWQLICYALTLLARHNWPTSGAQITECKVSFWTRDFEAEYSAQPDVDPTDREHLWRIQEADLTVEQLLQAIEDLQALTHRLTRNLPIWAEGSWCERCSGFRACPMQKSPVQRLGIALEGAVTEKDAAQVAVALPAVRNLVEQAERFLTRWTASQGELLIPGASLRRERQSRRTFTPDAPAVIHKLFPDLASAMLRESVSVARIAQALGEAVPGPLTEEVLTVLRRAGVMEEKQSFVLKTRKID